jgi:alanyl-tRNA synthetase
MGYAYPELISERNLIENVIREEEHSFLKTLDQGLILLEQLLEKSTSKTISGKKAFELFDTYGFPIDLTSLILRERGFELDIAEFDKELKKQKDRSRAATKVKTGDWIVLYEDPDEEFIGYDSLETNVKITRYRRIENQKDGEIYQLVFNLTPFYPEGGGQVGDKGYLEAPNGEVVYIIDTKKENNLIVHYVKNLPRQTDMTFKVVVDKKQRDRTAANHTATHLLHQALRNILGEHVTQKGSMVHSNYMRFDFSHFSKLSAEELKQVEDFVNARIREGIALEEHRNIPYQQAMDDGAIALFGEKYGDSVRAIQFGKSMELCGGTHVLNTKDIWHFIIISESAIASGIRRIEAVTGDRAKEIFKQRSDEFLRSQDLLNHPKDQVTAIEKLQEENAQLKKQIQGFQKDKAKNLKSDLKNEISKFNGVNFLSKKLDLDAAGMKDLSFELGGEIDNLFLLLGSSQNNKALLSCYISKDLASEKGLNAGTIVRELGKFINGGGGGQPFYATAGGKDPNGIDEALSKGKDYLV